MLWFFLGFVTATGCFAALSWFAWARVVRHLKGNPEGVAAFTSHVLLPLFGKKTEEANEVLPPES